MSGIASDPVEIPGGDKGTLLYSASVVLGHAGWSTPEELYRVWHAGLCSRATFLGSRITAVQLSAKNGGGWWKSVDRLPSDNPAADIAPIREAGVNHPSSYAACYHALAPWVKRVRWTHQEIFSWWPGGPWEEARAVGSHAGLWLQYDMKSAYRWAATLGMPDSSTYRVRTRFGSRPGLWVVEPKGSLAKLPPVFRRTPQVVMSSEELEKYGLAVKLVRGIDWDREHPTDYVESVLQRLPPPAAKKAGRAYWGRWIMRDDVRHWTVKREWTTPNIFTHFVWGWIIVSRVRSRLYEVSEHAVHVYVDEVIVPHELPTSADMGAWQLKAEYPNGVDVYRVGSYGHPGEKPTIQTGVKRNGPKED